MSGFRLFLFLIVAACVTMAVRGQSNVNLAQYNRDTMIPATTFTISVAGAKTWATGFTKTYLPASSACMEYRVILTVGAKFIQVSVTNPNICKRPKCDTDPNQAGCKWANYAIVAPFTVEWVDKSTTATYTLPTRQNGATGIPIEATVITIPEALDRTIATPLMDLVVRILPMDTNYISTAYDGWFYNVPSDANLHKEIRHSFSRTNAMLSLGISLYTKVRYYSSTYHMYMFTRRKQPTPPFVWKIQVGDGCTWGNYYANTFYNNCGWFNFFYQYGITNRFTYEYIDCSWCNDWYLDTDVHNSYWAWEFYEDFRLYRRSVTVDWATVKATTQDPANGYLMTVATNPPGGPNASFHDFPLRIMWRNLSYTRAGLTTAEERDNARKYASIQLVPPFAVQDVWVTVHNQAGSRLFTEMERRVPYRGSVNGPGQPGWAFPLTDEVTASTSMTIVLRYNRQHRLGATEEERRVALLRGFVEDNGGNVTYMQAPIPKTILAQDGLMGMVSTADPGFSAGDRVGTIAYSSCLTSNASRLYYTRHVARKLNASSEWYAYYDTVDTPWHKEHLMMTLMMVTDAVNELDYSTAYWAVADAFYPEQPTMLPIFWDPVQVSRLLGFSAIPDFIGYTLGNWSREHAMISEAWPWFAQEVTAAKWRNFRAHVRRSTWDEGNGELFLVPWIHLMRHGGGAPNVKLHAEWHTESIELTALADIGYLDEFNPDFKAGTMYKHEYLLRYGAVPAGARDACTVPGYDGYLDLTRPTRVDLVELWQQRYSLSYRQALTRVLSALSVKQTSLPVNVDGLGSTPEQVTMATALLNSEKTVLAWQIADGTAELATLQRRRNCGACGRNVGFMEAERPRPGIAS